MSDIGSVSSPRIGSLTHDIMLLKKSIRPMRLPKACKHAPRCDVTRCVAVSVVRWKFNFFYNGSALLLHVFSNASCINHYQPFLAYH